MARFVHGLLCGLVLLRLHRPLGRELLEVPAVPAADALAARSIALLGVAAAVLLARRSLGARSLAPWIVGAAVAVALEGLGGGFGREADGGSLPFAVLGLVLFTLRDARERGVPADAEEPRENSLPGLALMGAGLALGLEGLARHLRRLGAGLVADDAAFAATFAVLVALGAVTVGRALPRRGPRAAVGLSAVLAGGGLLAGLVALRGLATPPGMRTQLGRFGLDASDFGTVPVDAALGASVLVVTALFLGATLVHLRRRVELAAWLAGAAIGLQLVPALLTGPGDAGLAELPCSARLVPIGLALVGVGGALDALGRLARARAAVPFAQLGLSFAALAPALVLSPAAVPLQHWTRFPVAPRLVFESPEGLFLVRPGANPGVEEVVLDGRPIAPSPEAAPADRARLELALSLLGDGARARGPRVLLVGQLTPGRALVFARAGVVHLERTAAWWRVMERLEAALFADTPELTPAALGLAGGVVDPAAAAGKLERGEYDLVVVPAVPGRLPLVPRVHAADGLPVVVWFDGASAAAARAFEGPVLVSSAGLEDLAVGAVFGVVPATEPGREAPPFLEAGPAAPREHTYRWMSTRPARRGPRAITALAQRLEQANSETPWELVTRAYARHAEAQVESSPWASRAEATELDDDALELLVEAATTGAHDPWTLALVSGLADVLRGKRDVERVYRYVEPIHDVWPVPWRAGVLALAAADLEGLDPVGAAARLEPLFAEDPADVDAGALLARARREAGDPDGELAVLRELAANTALPRPVLRDYALALARAGELETARQLARPLLDADHEHEDTELREALDRP